MVFDEILMDFWKMSWISGKIDGFVEKIDGFVDLMWGTTFGSDFVTVLDPKPDHFLTHPRNFCDFYVIFVIRPGVFNIK